MLTNSSNLHKLTFLFVIIEGLTVAGNGVEKGVADAIFFNGLHTPAWDRTVSWRKGGELATPLEQRGSAPVCPPRHVGYVLKRWIPPLLEELCGSIVYRVKVTFFRCGFQSFY